MVEIPCLRSVSAKPIWFKTSGPKVQPLSGAPSPEAAPMMSITEVARGKDRPILRDIVHYAFLDNVSRYFTLDGKRT